MTRYIDANKIKLTGLTFEDINHEVYFSLSDIRKAIEQTPTADVVSRAEVDQIVEADKKVFAREIFAEIDRILTPKSPPYVKLNYIDFLDLEEKYTEGVTNEKL